MKKLICLIIILLCNPVIASLPDIVALVNDQPITRYDFISRKNMLIELQGIDTSNPANEAALNQSILNLLIEEELLNQYFEKTGNEIEKAQIDENIKDIEQKNNMPLGGMRTYLQEHNIPIEIFRKQIAAELMKQSVISSLSNSVSVSPSELDVAIINTNKSEFDVTAWIFTSKTSEPDAQKQMQNLKKKLLGCDQVEEKLYENFADAQKVDRKLKDMSSSTMSVIYDTKVGSTSSVYKEDDKFKLVLVCKKESSISTDDLAKIKAFLSNKKMSQKARKFFKDLRVKANIKIMTSS